MDSAAQLFTQILLERVAIIAAIAIAGAIGTVSTYVVKFIKAHLSAQQLKKAADIIGFVVLAADQSHFTDEVKATGAEKKAWALAESQRLLNERGLTGISAATLETLLESKVKELLNSNRIGTLEWFDAIPGEIAPEEPAPNR